MSIPDLPAQVLRSMRASEAARFFEQGDLEQAVVEAEELLDEDPCHEAALRIVAEASIELGQPEVAESAFRKLLRTSTGDPGCLLGLARALYHQLDFDGAMELLDRIADIAPGDAGAWELRAFVLAHLGRMDQSLEAEATAARLAPDIYPAAGRAMSEGEWRRVTAQALDGLPPHIQRWYRGVAIETAELPSREELEREDPPLDPDVTILPSDRLPEDPFPPEGSGPYRPRAVTLYRWTIEHGASNPEDLRRLVAEALEAAAGWCLDPCSED